MRSSSQATAALLALAVLAPQLSGQGTCPVIVLEAELVPSQPVKGGHHGTRVSLSGGTLASSAPVEDAGAVKDAGAVYVSTREGSSWEQEARLVAGAPSSGDFFGLGLALHQDTLAVGAPCADHDGTDDGTATVFVRTGAAWSEQALLAGAGGQNGAAFGWSVALDGDLLVVGAPEYNNGAGPGSGAAFVYARAAGVWTLDGVLTASDPQDKGWFGYSLAVSGSTVLVGAYGQGTLNQGAAYVFVRAGPGAWTEQAKLVESPSLAQRLFGFAVALEGDRAYVGAPSTGLLIPAPGSVHAFVRVGSLWSHSAEVVASDGLPLDFFGGAIDVAGPRLAVSASDAGKAYLFVLAGAMWVERLVVTTAELAAERFEGLALQADTLLLGSPFDDLPGALDGGKARSLRYTSGVNPSVNYCAPGTSASGCQAAISACGAPSASASGGFVLVVSVLEGSKDGIFFVGTNGRQANPWGNGTSFQCVVPPVFRGGLIEGSGTTGLCDGRSVQDFNALWCPTCPAPGKNPGAGSLVQAQFWYRDPLNTSNQTTSLSNALEFTVAP